MTTPVIPSTGSPMVVRPYWDSAAIWQYGTLPPSGIIPSNLTGLVGWYDASAIAGITSGTSLSTWTDLSGSGNHLGQSSATVQPVFLTQQQNTLSAVSFFGVINSNATPSVMTASFTLSQPTTLLLTFSLNTKVTNVQQDLCDGFGVTTMIMGTAASGAGQNLEIYAGAALSTSQAFTVNTWYVASAVFNGSTSSVSFDGAGGAGNAGAGTPSGFALGGRQNRTTFAQIKVGEVVLYNRALIPTDVRSLENYLKLKWGTT